jgi:hypothetical protein
MLTSLGEPFVQDSGQMELELLAGEAQGDAMLAELDDEAEAEEPIEESENEPV